MKIGQITVQGEVDIKFNQDMMIPPNFEKLPMDQFIEFKIESVLDGSTIYGTYQKGG